MTPGRWQKVKEICYEVLDCEPGVREVRLAELCADEDICRDVIAMMAGIREDENLSGRPAWGVLGVPAVALEAALTEDAGAAPVPEYVGRYRILRVIGEGGMGVVYEAEQIEPQRTVALKVIRPGLASGEAMRRFRQESQALGRLQHPGIAQVYEAGTAEGRFGPQPYFAMEFIRGLSLREYTDARRLTVRDRLELLAKVCDAVDHAHQRGLIHRDLKPANILVDESGQPKILDFGVARITDADVRKTQHTHLGQLVGTLAYMSPEQVLADPMELDTRSDVYALGVMLYELLAGTLPYTISQRIPEAVRTIQEQDPKRLSSINKTFRGDLETIAARALEKDKNRRYGSAAALAADIRRYLGDEPIAARPASATYQLQKFARRHRALVGGIVAVFLVLVAGIVTTTREALRARQAELSAKSAEEIAVAVRDFLQNDLIAQASVNNQAGPSRKPDPELTIRKALDRAAAGVESKFGKRPEVEADIRQTIGRAYRDLGLYVEAQEQLERAVRLARGTVPAGHRDLLARMDDLGSVYYLRGKYALAEPLISEVVDIRRRVNGPDDPDTLMAMNNLGLLYGFQGKNDQAASMLESTLAARRRVSGESHPETLTLMANLSQVYDRLGRYREAEALSLKTIEMARRIKGEEHPDTLSWMNNLTSVYRNQGRYADADTLLQTVLSVRQRALGPEHPNTLTTMNNIGNVYLDEGKIAEADELFTRLLETRRRVIGESHPNTILTMNNLARVQRFEGRNREAAALLADALAISKRVSGDEHPDTLLIASNLAYIDSLLGDFDRAETVLNKTLQIRLQRLGPNHPETLVAKELLALLKEAKHEYTNAAVGFTEVANTRRRVLGDTHRDTLSAWTSLGRVQLADRKFADAAATLRPAIAGYERAVADSWQHHGCETLLGLALAGQKMFANAEPLLIAGHDGMMRLRSTMPVHERHLIEEARRALVDLYRRVGNQERATEWAHKLQDDMPDYRDRASAVLRAAGDDQRRKHQ